MSEGILVGKGSDIVSMPLERFEELVAQAPQRQEKRLRFMTEEHHRLRYFVVREMPAMGKPLPPEWIAGKLGLPLDRVESLLDELERNLFFLMRNARGEVSWAYPVTVEETPHRMTFDRGERLYGA